VITTDTETSTQTSYDGTSSLNAPIANILKLCTIGNPNKLSALKKEACEALGLDFGKTGNKSPEWNLSVFEWLRDNKTTIDDATAAEPNVDIADDLPAPLPKNVIVPIGINAIPALPKLTAIEARQKVNNVKSCLNIARNELLDLRDRDGWRALGYESWEEFGAKEFDYSVQYLNRITTAASIQKSLETIVSEGEIKETHLRPLTSIPENERAAIWKEANRKAEEVGKERTAKMVQDAVNEWKAKHDAVQNDLLAVKQQNDDLRGNIDAKVSAVIATERAALILENSNTIAQVERERDNAANDIERLKREQDKAITDGIGKKMLELDNEIRSKEQSIYVLEKRTAELLETKSSLDNEVGLIQVHKRILESAKTELQAFTISFAEAFDTGTIPSEVTGDWQQIRTAIKQLDSKMDEFFTDNAPIDGAVLVGELVI
jgi:hypothetical protein